MDRLLKIDEVAERLNVAIPTSYGWVHRRKVPFVKLFERNLRFRESDVNGLVEAGLHEPEETSAETRP